ncbi:hypothetical protein [Oceanobacillus profundus]|uniref:Uncharacterized protein n=1 Tax=Oceanobacillus profundus TaxID=372463 RepID=A0A417YJX1_9BACI|nr:hypothetical protein [Oceanobacillus profundus]RHW33510.1 hypothetical protein D1B32_05555 [Oceanobacillus profundus]
MEIIEKLFLLVPVTVIITIITYSVNYWDATKLEKRLMTNIQRLKVYLSIIFTATLLYTLLLALISLFNESSTEENINDLFLISGFIMFMVLLIITSTILSLANFIFSIKPRYVIFLENDSKPWDIFKPIGKKGLLLNRDNEFKFINDYYNLPIKKVALENDWRKSFYSPNKQFSITTLALLFVFILCIVVLNFNLFNSIWIVFCLILISIISSIIFLLIIINFYMYNKFPNLID